MNLMRLKTPHILLLTLCLCSVVMVTNAQMNLRGEEIIYSTDEVNSFTDTTAHFTVRNIQIEGNKRTKPYIILRELNFHENEQYALHQLVEKFRKAKIQLMNSGLFLDVVVSLKALQGYEASVLISVIERWYLIPMPYAKVVDKSFQDWVKNQGMDLGRINYGMKVTHKNLTGRNDRLNVDFTNGYTKEVGFKYENLPLDKNLTWFAGFNIAYGKNREINYTTQENQAISMKIDDEFVHKFFTTSFELSYRPAIKTKHSLGIGYTYDQVSDSISKVSYLYAFNRNNIRYPEMYYRLQYFDVDFIPYPSKGYAADITIAKKGFQRPIDVWQLTARTSASWPVNDRSFFNLRLTGVLKLPFEQPYMMQKFVGNNGMYIQGYEDFVIDGVAGGFTKATFTRQIFSTAVRIRSDKFKFLNFIPIKAYGKVYGNAGYIYNDYVGTNRLNNKMLYSGGVGLDVILFYDFIFRLEWSMNHLGQNGLYLHDRDYL